MDTLQNKKQSSLKQLFSILVNNQAKQLSQKTLQKLSQKITSPSKFWRKIACAILLSASHEKEPSLMRFGNFSGYLIKSLTDLKNDQIERLLKKLQEEEQLNHVLAYFKGESKEVSFLAIDSLNQNSLKASLKLLPDPQDSLIFCLEKLHSGFENKNEVKIGDLNWNEDKEKVKKFKKKVDEEIEKEYGKRKSEREEIEVDITLSLESSKKSPIIQPTLKYVKKWRKAIGNIVTSVKKKARKSYGDASFHF